MKRTSFPSRKGTPEPAKKGKDHREKRKAVLDSAARRSLRRIERLVRASAAEGGITTEWENEFLADVHERLNRFGRAFADPEKGSLEFATSIRQTVKLKEIRRSIKRKAKGQAV